MFEKIRRKDYSASEKTAYACLNKALFGVLSVAGENGYPCGTPFNFALDGSAVYIHTSSAGYTSRCVKNSGKACFTVVNACRVIPQDFVCSYESVMVFGRAEICADEEKRKGLDLLVDKYSPDFKQEGQALIDKSAADCDVIKISIEHISGKIRDARQPDYTRAR